MNSWPTQAAPIDDAKIHEIVVDAIKAVSSGLQGGDPASLELDTCIYGSSGFMDSVGLVALVLEIERELEERCGLTLPIMDDKAFSKQHSPFRSLSALEGYVKQRISDVYGE
jgi:acyl carrier protein